VLTHYLIKKMHEVKRMQETRSLSGSCTYKTTHDCRQIISTDDPTISSDLLTRLLRVPGMGVVQFPRCPVVRCFSLSLKKIYGSFALSSEWIDLVSPCRYYFFKAIAVIIYLYVHTCGMLMGILTTTASPYNPFLGIN
jgi:hypothetical protein